MWQLLGCILLSLATLLIMFAVFGEMYISSFGVVLIFLLCGAGILFTGIGSKKNYKRSIK